jgi:hypothetical protein
MTSKRSGIKWKLAVIAIVAAGVLLAALFISPGARTSRGSSSGGMGIQRALAAESYQGSGLAANRLLGLFTENVNKIMKVKVPTSERPAIRNIRIFAKWNKLEGRSKNRFDWRKLDAEINGALSMGVNSILITVTGPVPPWAVNKNNPRPNDLGPPRIMKNWGDFCYAVAKRYKGYVDYFQLWQEPGWDVDSPAGQNGVVYYASWCDLTYMGMMRSGYQAIKKANPQAYVMTGSMLNGLTLSESDFYNYETLLAGGNQDISMTVHSNNTDIVAERPMYFNYHGSIPGGNVNLGVNKAQRVWYLAEGATHPGFEEWLSIQNPKDKSTHVDLTYMFPGGKTQAQAVDVPAHSRFTIDVNSTVGPDKNVSVKVVSQLPIVVERPMYFIYHGKWAGGSIDTGVNRFSKKWCLAEGATQPGFEEWISLMNPSSSPAYVRITYMFEGGKTQVQTVNMAPTSREQVNVNDAVGPNKNVSAMVESNRGIIADRPMYFLYHGAWAGGDTQHGAYAPDTSWFLSEGTTRNNSVDGSFEEWISIMNPGDKDTKVDLTYMFTGGGTKPGAAVVPAHARKTILVNDQIGPNKDVSVQLDSEQPVVVERPQYFNYHNNKDGGDVELGCTGAKRTWYFAEGTTREGFEEWLTLQNPADIPTSVDITFMFGDTTTQQKQVILPPKSRSTVNVNNSVSIATVADAISIHPYHYPVNWAWYYNNVVNILNKNGYGYKEVVVSEIGWPHAGRAEFSPEGQRQAIGEVGLGSLFAAGCKKIWVFEDVDPPSSWDNAFNGMFDINGSPMPAWWEYKKWQTQLPDYGNKPKHLW